MNPSIVLRKVTAIGLVTFALSSCFDAELTRSKAEKDIGASEAMREFQMGLPFFPGSLARGEEQGFWAVQGARIVLENEVAPGVTEVTQEGILVSSPVAISVAVTGISDRPGTANLKDVLFTWKYIEFPGKTKRFVADGGVGTAVFRLFDDGWRLDNVNAEHSGKGTVLSPNERTEQEVDLAAEAKRISEYFAAQTKLRNEKARLDAERRLQRIPTS